MPQTLAVRSVGEIMNRKPVTVLSQATIGELAKLFATSGLETLPVLDAEGSLCGIVSTVDVLRVLQSEVRAGAGTRSLLSRRVETVMRPGVITVEATDPILAAVDLMAETRFHALPVVRRGEGGPVLVGMVHQRELLTKLLKSSPIASTRQPAQVRR
jgi:CBS-domain-containing membrane protein